MSPTADERPAGAARRRRPGPLLLLLLLALTISGFAVTRALRVSDDVVNSVSLTERIAPGEAARVAFTTTVADPRADVLITDTEDRQVRALQLGEELSAGPHEFHWRGLADDGSPVPPGEYGLRVILGEADRDIKPPGRITVAGPGTS